MRLGEIGDLAWGGSTSWVGGTDWRWGLGWVYRIDRRWGCWPASWGMREIRELAGELDRKKNW